MSVERPDNGARFVFDRVAVEPAAVRYAVTVALPDRELAFSFVVDAGTHAIGLCAPADPGPEWIAPMVLAFAKTVASQNKDEPLEAWPKRLVRWRQK